jgi:hypothetical protein
MTISAAIAIAFRSLRFACSVTTASPSIPASASSLAT